MDTSPQILIVESDRTAALEMRRALEAGGYHPAVVSSGEDAVKRAEKLRPDLVLVDALLEGKMDGAEAAGQIHTRFDIPVVYVAADTGETTLEEIKRAQPFGCVFKPFKDLELQAAVEVALHRHAEKDRLRESGERYRTIIEDIEDAYYEVDLDGRFTFSNLAMCALANIPPDELTGMSYLDYTDSETAKKLYKTFFEVFQTGKFSDVEDYEIIRKDGSKRTVEFSISLVRDGGGEPIGFRGIARDVTERRAMEAALRESEESYRNILDLAPDAITIVRASDGVHLQVNDAICQQTGYRADEIIGRTASELNLYADPADRRRLIGILEQEGRMDGVEVRYRAKDGTILDDLVSARPIRFRGEDCFLVMATVITSLKEAQRALRRSEERYRTILESIEDGYWEVDLEGRFTFVNDALSRMVGIPVEELVGMNSLEHTPPEAEEKISSIFNGIYRTGKSTNVIDFEVMRLDGDVAVHELSVSLMRDEDGNPIGFRGVSRDVTARKEAEREIRNHREHLALINQILRHDLTNDLLVIQSALNLYGRSSEEDYLGEASGRVSKSLDLIARMKELESFISSHGKLKTYEVRDVVTEVAKGYPAMDFVIEGRARVMADESLFSVIDNIVRNAFIHGRADRIDITMAREDNMCEVRISDNGSGIPDEVKETIFEEGFIYGDTGHTGLGLHVVKKVMESYGGYAYAYDNKPRGAVFALRFKAVA